MNIHNPSISRMDENNKLKPKFLNTYWTDVKMSTYSNNRNVLMISFVLLVLCYIIVPVRSWDCVCNPRECEVLEPSGCPGLGVIVWDPCRCCKICARTLGESCGGFSGTCEPGLKCFDGICTGNS